MADLAQVGQGFLAIAPPAVMSGPDLVHAASMAIARLRHTPAIEAMDEWSPGHVMACRAWNICPGVGP